MVHMIIGYAMESFEARP